MKVDSGKLQTMTAAAILVLISGGIAAYAQSQSSSTAGAAMIGAASTSSSTSSTNSTSSTSASHVLCTPPTTPGKVGRLILPITPSGSQASTISFSDGRGCVASITTVGGIFSVQIALRYAKPLTQYNVVLVANGTNYVLGNMVTGQEGAGQMQNQVLLKTGTYLVSLQIFDTSSTPGQSTLVLQTGQGTIVSPAFPSPGSNPQSNHGDKDESGQDR